MREILGRRRRTRSALLDAALTCAERWHWPVLPGAGMRTRPSCLGLRRDRDGSCACLLPECVVPGAHPEDPGLLAATSDPRMVRWWWTNRPDAPIVLATGTAVSAVSLPAVSGRRALRLFDLLGVRVGPVTATTTRLTLLVAPYSMEELGELLHEHDWVPSSLRYHGRGGYVVLPPSEVGAGRVRWERPPPEAPGGGAPWLPTVTAVVDALVEASRLAPDGTRLAY